MRLPFKQTIKKGVPSYFLDKIWHGLLSEKLTTRTQMDNHLAAYESKFIERWDLYIGGTCQKYHTIRKDKRWHDGLKVQFYTGNRFKPESLFEFAPSLPVLSVQEIRIDYIKHQGEKIAIIFIDNEYFSHVSWNSLGEMHNTDYNDFYKALREFVQNDGFETIEDFFDWFNSDFDGLIIHWTDLKY